MRTRVPMSVIGGFLGAGKTTLLNRLLAGSHGVRYAVLVNDFGDLDVDGALVAAHGGDTLSFSNGCLCCAFGDDLVACVDRLLGAPRPPEQLVVEASGVADPAALADVATLHPELVRDLVIVLADVASLRARHTDPRLTETLARQLEAADLLALNKCDLVDEAARREAARWVRGHTRAAVVETVGADLDLRVLRDAGPSPDPGSPHPVSAHPFRTCSVACARPVDPDRLRASLAALAPRVLRAKGFVVPAAGAERLLVQGCGPRVDIGRFTPREGEPLPRAGLVFIGLDDLPDREELESALESACV